MRPSAAPVAENSARTPVEEEMFPAKPLRPIPVPSVADAFVSKQMITRTLLPAIGDVAEALDKEAEKLLGLSPARKK
jgi:hypothetical protein